MKLELTIEKNVVLKRDKPWSKFYHYHNEELLCYNEQKKFESVSSSNGKIDHLSNKSITNLAKSSLTYCFSNNGSLCGFLAANYEITIWDKSKLIRTLPACTLAVNAIKTTPTIFISNSGEQAILIIRKPYRLFVWLKSLSTPVNATQQHHHKGPMCSCTGNRTTDQHGTWHEILLTTEQSDSMNSDQYRISIDCYFYARLNSIVCAFVFFDQSGYMQINRFDIDWKSTIYAEQFISYSFEVLQIPMMISSIPSTLCSVRFAHQSPILAISLLKNIVLTSLTTVAFSKLVPIDCTSSTSTNQEHVLIDDVQWSSDDQFIIGITNRGALFFLTRFGSQINLMTQGDCISQGPLPYVIIHPLIGKDSEATTHLGVDSFMQAIASVPTDIKNKPQIFSACIDATATTVYCSDGYRLARVTYSDKTRDRRFYDPLLHLYLLDLTKQQQAHSVVFRKTKSFDDVTKVNDHADTESIGGGMLNMASRHGSLVSLAMDDVPQLSVDDIFTAYHLLFTSSSRVQHDICACLENSTRALLISPDRNDVLTSIDLSQCLTNLVLSSGFGSLAFLRLSCLGKFIPLFIDIFEKQTTIVNDPELLLLCILYIIEQWLQAVLYIPTKLTTFELCRPQKSNENVDDDDDETNIQLCKAVNQLELLQGKNINVDEFLSVKPPGIEHSSQPTDQQYNRLTLIRSWYTLWLEVEQKSRRDIKNLPQYLVTMRLFIQSVLHSYPSLSSVRLLTYGRQPDLNELFPPVLTTADHPLHTKSYTTLNERRKQRRRPRTSSVEPLNSARPYRRTKPPTEARKALVLHRILYALIEQYNIRDAVCILNVALRRETSHLSSCLPLDLFSANLFQHIDTRTHFGMPGNALRSVLRSLARFMARSMIKVDQNEDQQSQLFVYSVDTACPLPTLFRTKQKMNEHMKYRTIYIDQNRLNLAIQQQKLSKFWQPLKVLELFILGQSPSEAVWFAKLVGDWRSAVCLASVLPPHNGLSDTPKLTRRSSISFIPLNAITADALLYTKLCEYLHLDDIKTVLKHTYKLDEIKSFVANLSATLEQFLLCATLLRVPLTEMLLRRLNATMMYLFTLTPIFISSKYYLPCPPIYSPVLNTYDDEKYDIACKYETHIRLLYYRTIHIFIQLLSASRVQLSCLKWYLDYLIVPENRRKPMTLTNETNDSFHSVRMLLKSLRFHKLPNIPDRILMYFRDFCTMLFLVDTRDRLSLTLRQYIRSKIETTNQSDRLSWKIISYATMLLSFRCLLSDEMDLLRVVLNLFFDLKPSESLTRALAMLMVARQQNNHDSEDNAELTLLVDRIKAKWMKINPTYIQLYEGFLETIILQDVQEDIVQHYMNNTNDHNTHEPLFDFKPKWFETSVEYGEFMTMLIPQLLDTSSLYNAKQQELNSDHTKFDSKSIPLVHTMSDRLRELELPISLDKRYLLKQPPLFVPPHEYVVFPVHTVHYDAQQTMFQQPPTSINNATVGNFVQTPLTQQPPGVVTLESHYRRSNQNLDVNMDGNHPNPGNNETSWLEWDGRSDDPTRSHVRQFDEPYAEAARRSIRLNDWANHGFTTISDQTQTLGMRIPISAQFLAASSLVSDPQNYEAIVRQHVHPTKQTNEQLENDTDLTNITKDSEEDDGNNTRSDAVSSPRRRDVSFRRNSIEESVSIYLPSNDGGGDLGRTLDFRAPSRETGIDETSYPMEDFPTDYYKGPTTQHDRPPHGASPSPFMSPSTPHGPNNYPPQPPSRLSHTDRRFMDDSDPGLQLPLEQDDRDKYPLNDKTPTSIQSPFGNYPSSRDPHGYQPSYQDPSSHHSPTKDPQSRRSTARETTDRRSLTREPHSHRSSSREPNGDYHHYQQQPQQQQLPQIQAPILPVNGIRGPIPTTYTSSVRLPLLRLGGPVVTTRPLPTNMQLPLAPPVHSQSSVPPPGHMQIPEHHPGVFYPPRPAYVPAAVVTRPPIALLHLTPQLPPPVSLSPGATRVDQQKLAYVQNAVQQFVGCNRPQLPLLQLRPLPRLPEPPVNLSVPMPVPNVVSKSTETKVDAGVQAEVPRQDGFVIEPGLFQALLRDATGVNFTSAEAHYSAARQIQQQALDARRRERSTMTDLPAHQILYDLQYTRGGDGDERKFVNVTDIVGSHADALLEQIHRDQYEREQTRLREQQQHQPPSLPQQPPTLPQQPPSISPPPPVSTTTDMNGMSSAVRPLGFDLQHAEILGQQPDHIPRPSYQIGFEHQHDPSIQAPIDFLDPELQKQKSDLILQRRRQREEEFKQAERTAFGHTDDDHPKRVTYEPHAQVYESDPYDISLEHLIRPQYRTEPLSGGNENLVDPISVRSHTARSQYDETPNEYRPSARTNSARDPSSPHKQTLSDRSIPTKTSARGQYSPHKEMIDEHPVTIKTTTPHEPFSARKPSPRSSHMTTNTSRQAASPTIADKHREARQKLQKKLSRERDRDTLLLADAALHGEPVPPSRALSEFQLEALETSFTSTVRELAGPAGLVNRTYDLDLVDLDDDDDNLGGNYSQLFSSRPMSTTGTNYNQNTTQHSNGSSVPPRPSSASSSRSSRRMTPMGKAIVQVKQKGPPPARSTMARRRPMSSPANLTRNRGSTTVPAKSNQTSTRFMRSIRKASPPAHKPTTYNERVRALNKTDSEVRPTAKSDSVDPKALMRIYGSRRVPGLYVPYEKTDPRVTKTYAEQMQELQRPASIQPRRVRQSSTEQEPDYDQRPSSAPSSSMSLSDWEVDDRIKQLLADDSDLPLSKKGSRTVTPLGDLDELDDNNMDETTYSLTRVTEPTIENTYGDDLRQMSFRRTAGLNTTNTYGGTRVSARSSAGGDMTARDESELSKGETSYESYLDWSIMDRDYLSGTQ